MGMEDADLKENASVRKAIPGHRAICASLILWATIRAMSAVPGIIHAARMGDAWVGLQDSKHQPPSASATEALLVLSARFARFL